MMARVAVDSALNNTNLMPVLLFDGESDHEIATWMTSRGNPSPNPNPNPNPNPSPNLNQAFTDNKAKGLPGYKDSHVTLLQALTPLVRVRDRVRALTLTHPNPNHVTLLQALTPRDLRQP